LRQSKLIVEALRKFFSPGEKSNWKVVALCFLGATTFWFFNALNKNYATRISYPVEFVYDPEGVVVTEELPRRVNIDVSGGGWNLLRKTVWVKMNPIRIMLDNPTTQKYITKASLTPIIADQLEEIRLNYVVTDTLFLHIERQESKPVVLRIDSMRLPLEKGYQLTSPIRIEPDSVIFTGPLSFIDTLADTLFVPLSLSKLQTDLNTNIDLNTLVPETADVQPAQVNVRFTVGRFLSDRRLVRIRRVNFPDNNIRMVDSLSVVTFRVAENRLEEVQRTGFYVEADFDTFNPADSTVGLQLVAYPQGVLQPSLDVERVRVRVREPKTNQRR
jgi:hypothetical protein